jgi:hypothetical protein
MVKPLTFILDHTIDKHGQVLIQEYMSLIFTSLQSCMYLNSVETVNIQMRHHN